MTSFAVAQEEPEARLFTFLPDGDDKTGPTLTRGELDRQACAIAARLQELGPDSSGARALLLYPPGLEFITAFFGCLYAGVVAVPAYLPRSNRPMTRLQSLIVDAQPCAVLICTSQSSDSRRWEAGVPELRGVRRLVTDAADVDVDELAGRWRDPHAQHETLAFLQYTSGSTSLPKGVMITHGNLLHNSALIRDCFDSSPESRGVFWLPLFHDMGLIGGVIQTLYCGGASTLFSPVSFVQRPIRWLQTISDTRAMISGAPNFAYELCVEKTTPEQRALSGPELLARGLQRRRADPSGNSRSLCGRIRVVRIPQGSISALLRSRRGDTARFGRTGRRAAGGAVG